MSESDSRRRAESRAGLDMEGYVYFWQGCLVSELKAPQNGLVRPRPVPTLRRGMRSGEGKVLFPSQCWLSSY